MGDSDARGGDSPGIPHHLDYQPETVERMIAAGATASTAMAVVLEWFPRLCLSAGPPGHARPAVVRHRADQARL